MRLVSRGVTLAAALAVVAGCGGSVADADVRAARVPTRAPASPFCAAVQANAAASRPLNEIAAKGGAAGPELARTVDAVRRANADVVATAPTEIRNDVERSVATVNQQLDALLAHGGDAAAAARETNLANRPDATDLASATERVRSYIARTCTTR